MTWFVHARFAELRRLAEVASREVSSEGAVVDGPAACPDTGSAEADAASEPCEPQALDVAAERCGASATGVDDRRNPASESEL